MGSTFFPIFMLMLATAGISIAFGYKLGNTPIPEEELEQIKEKAFEEAKAEYLEWFHKRFTSDAERLAEVYNEELLRENEALRKLNKQLNKEIKKLKGEE